VKRASYRHAVAWLSMLVADLFGVEPARVAADVARCANSADRTRWGT